LVSYKRPRVQLHAQGIVQRDEVPGALIKTKAQQVCRAGEFLVAEIDAKVGGFGIVPASLDGSIVSSHYFLFLVDEAKLTLGFLDYFIRTPAFREQGSRTGLNELRGDQAGAGISLRDPSARGGPGKSDSWIGGFFA
jgi:type I restriction enzyme, S subunit